MSCSCCKVWNITSFLNYLFKPFLFSLIVGDVDGNIAHFVTGRFPIRKGSTDGVTPSRGWLNENEWQGSLTWEGTVTISTSHI